MYINDALVSFKTVVLYLEMDQLSFSLVQEWSECWFWSVDMDNGRDFLIVRVSL